MPTLRNVQVPFDGVLRSFEFSDDDKIDTIKAELKANLKTTVERIFYRRANNNLVLVDNDAQWQACAKFFKTTTTNMLGMSPPTLDDIELVVEPSTSQLPAAERPPDQPSTFFSYTQFDQYRYTPSSGTKDDPVHAMEAAATRLFAELHQTRELRDEPPSVSTLRDFSARPMLSPAGKQYLIDVTRLDRALLSACEAGWTACTAPDAYDKVSPLSSVCADARWCMEQVGIVDPIVQMARMLVHACLSADAQTHTPAQPDAVVPCSAWVVAAEQSFFDNFRTRLERNAALRQAALATDVPSDSKLDRWFKDFDWADDVDAKVLEALVDATLADAVARLADFIGKRRQRATRATARQPIGQVVWNKARVLSEPEGVRPTAGNGCFVPYVKGKAETSHTGKYYDDAGSLVPNDTYSTEWYECEYPSVLLVLAARVRPDTTPAASALLAMIRSVRPAFRSSTLWDCDGNHLLTYASLHQNTLVLQDVLQCISAATAPEDVAYLASEIAASDVPLSAVRLLYAWTPTTLQLQWVGALYAARKDSFIVALVQPAAAWFVSLTRQLNAASADRARQLLARLTAL